MEIIIKKYSEYYDINNKFGFQLEKDTCFVSFIKEIVDYHINNDTDTPSYVPVYIDAHQYLSTLFKDINPIRIIKIYTILDLVFNFVGNISKQLKFDLKAFTEKMKDSKLPINLKASLELIQKEIFDNLNILVTIRFALTSVIPERLLKLLMKKFDFHESSLITLLSRTQRVPFKVDQFTQKLQVYDIKEGHENSYQNISNINGLLILYAMCKKVLSTGFRKITCLPAASSI